MYIKFLSITKTLRFRILFPLMLIILSVSFLEIYYLNHYAFTVVEDIVLDTKAKNASQVLNGIERYFSNIETIAKKPLNTIEISSLLGRPCKYNIYKNIEGKADIPPFQCINSDVQK